MSTGPDLQVKITTTADTAGVVSMARELATANEKAGEFGRTLTKLTNDQLLGLEDKLRSEIKATDALGKSTEQLKRQLTEVYTQRTGSQEMARSAEATRSLGNAAKTSAGQLAQLKTAGGEVSQVFSGLQAASQGGASGLLGLMQAGRGALGLFRTMGAVLLGPVGLGLGAAAAGIAYLGRIANQNKAAIEKIFTDAGKESAALKEKYAQLETAAKISLESQISEVNRLTDAYRELLGMMDAAEQRSGQLNEATTRLALAQLDQSEQEALSKATTPEAREKITKDFAAKRSDVQQRAASGALDNQLLSASVRRENARETLSAQQGLIDNAAGDARAKRSAANAAIAVADQEARESGAGSLHHREAMATAKAAIREADLAEDNSRKVSAAAGGVQDAAQKQIEGANHMERMTGLSGQTMQAERRAGTLKQSNEARAKVQTSSTQTEAEAAAIAAQIGAKQDELDRRPGMSIDPRNAALVEQIAALKASHAAKLTQIGEAFAGYSQVVQGSVEVVTTTVNAERSKAQRLAERQALISSQQSSLSN